MGAEIASAGRIALLAQLARVHGEWDDRPESQLVMRWDETCSELEVDCYVQGHPWDWVSALDNALHAEYRPGNLFAWIDAAGMRVVPEQERAGFRLSYEERACVSRS